MMIGYARVSTQAQSLDRQIGALNGVGVERIYREKATGRTVKGRPQLEKAIDALGTGDIFVIAELDRATRSMMDVPLPKSDALDLDRSRNFRSISKR